MGDAEKLRRQLVGTHFERHFIAAFKGTIKVPGKRLGRVTKNNTWFTNERGDVDMISPVLWMTSQQIISDGGGKSAKK